MVMSSQLLLELTATDNLLHSFQPQYQQPQFLNLYCHQAQSHQLELLAQRAQLTPLVPLTTPQSSNQPHQEMELRPSQIELSLPHQDMNTLYQPLLVQVQLPQQPQIARATQLHMVLNHTTRPLTTQEKLPAQPTRLLATMVTLLLMNMLPTLMEELHL